MAKTVTMRKGVIYADIFDSPETIAQAQKDGYHLCGEAEAAARSAVNKPASVNVPPVPPAAPVPGSAVTHQVPLAPPEAPPVPTEAPVVTPPEQVPLTEQPTGLAALSKKDLLEFIGKRKLFEKAYKDMEPVAIIPKVLEKARDKIIEAGLKTAYEAASIPEHELFILFDTLK